MNGILEAVKSWATFHINDYQVDTFHVRSNANPYELTDDSSDRLIVEFLHHKSSGDLFEMGDNETPPSMMDLAKKNAIVGLGMGLANWYYWGLAIKDAGFCAYQTATAAKTLWASYKEKSASKEEIAFNRLNFVSTEVPRAFNPAVRSGMHAVKNFAMFSFLNAYSPTILTYNVVVGGAAALYGVRNPLNFQSLFTRFDNWWTADVEPMDQFGVKQLPFKEKLQGLNSTHVKLYQILFPEPITKVANPLIGDDNMPTYELVNFSFGKKEQ